MYMGQPSANDMCIVPNRQMFCADANGIGVCKLSTLQCSSLLQSMSVLLETLACSQLPIEGSMSQHVGRPVPGH